MIGVETQGTSLLSAANARFAQAGSLAQGVVQSSTVLPGMWSVPVLSLRQGTALQNHPYRTVDQYLMSATSSGQGAGSTSGAPPAGGAGGDGNGSDDGDGAPKIKIEVGSRFYHADLGPVEIIGIKDVGGGRRLLEIMTGGKRMTCIDNPKIMLPFGSEEAQVHLKKYADDRYWYLPEVTAFGYMYLHRERYRGYFQGIVQNDDPKGANAVIGLLKTASSEYVLRTRRHRGPVKAHPHFVAPTAEWRSRIGRGARTDERLSRSNFYASDQLWHIAREIYRLTGDDLMELGFQRFNGRMESLAEVLVTIYRRRGRTERKVHLRDDVMKYTMSLGLSIAATFSEDDQKAAQHVFAAGDYDDDNAAYDALRDNDEVAIDSWAGQMAGIFTTHSAILSGVDLLVPILGREGYGWPVATLAERIGAEVGLSVDRELWKPRPDDLVASEAGMSFARKEDQAATSHVLRKGVGDRVKDRTIGLVDDNFTTGATYRAAAGELRAAGAKDVFLVSATKTNRQK